jgi:hypothetical protein
MALICVPSSRSSDAVPGSGIRYLEAFVEGKSVQGDHCDDRPTVLVGGYDRASIEQVR